MTKLTGKAVCELGVGMVVNRLLRSGFAVHMPVVDTGHDVLASVGRTYWRLQVKATATTCKHNGRRVGIRRGYNKGGRYSKATCDALVAVHVTQNIICCVPIEKLAGRQSLGFSSPTTSFAELRKGGRH